MAADRHTKKKVLLAENLVAKLKMELDDPNLYFLLDYQVNKLYPHPKIRRKNKELPIKMMTQYMDKLMHRYLRAPSKWNTKKRLHYIAIYIKNTFQMHHSDEDMAKLVFDNQQHIYKYINRNDMLGKRKWWKTRNRLQHGDI